METYHTRAIEPAVPGFDGPGDMPVPQLTAAQAAPRMIPIMMRVGVITEVAGGKALCVLDRSMLAEASRAGDFSVQMAGQIGSYLKTFVAGTWVFTTVRALKIDGQFALPDQTPTDLVMGELDFVGEAFEGRSPGSLQQFRRGITRYPSPGDVLHTVCVEDLNEVFSAQDQPHITMGTVYPTDRVRAALFVDPLLGKHFALLGSTGTGKSTTVALLLHRIIEKSQAGHILMLDPHGEYGAAFKTNGVVYDASNIELPYWLMNFEEHVEVLIGSRGPEAEVEIDILAKCLLAARSKSRVAAEAGRVTVDSPVPYLLSDLLGALTANMGKLDKPEKVGPYLRLKAKIEELKSDPRYAFMFSGLMVSDTFADLIQRIFRMPGGGRPISILDLSGVPSDIVKVVVAVLARLVFDFAVWSKSDQQRPILLVCEEAHRYVPAERLDTFGPARKVLERIAKEGRKYGVSLGLISQRPSDLSESVLSQCGTIISLRMNNDRDQAYVRNAMPEGARGFLDTLPALRNRECIICGEGVSIPIRVRIDELEPEKRPASDDPKFSELWSNHGGEADLVMRVIKKWRAQGR
jgi:DNA helicase HerA-like ATPase